MSNQETPERTPEEAARLQEFSRRMEALVPKAIEAIAPMDVAGTFIGIGWDLIEKIMGRDGAVAYLRELADSAEPPTSADSKH